MELCKNGYLLDFSSEKSKSNATKDFILNLSLLCFTHLLHSDREGGGVSARMPDCSPGHQAPGRSPQGQIGGCQALYVSVEIVCPNN
jgi:hypothetical protein